VKKPGENVTLIPKIKHLKLWMGELWFSLDEC